MFDPKTKLTGDIKIIENAVIVPYGEGDRRGITRRAGVYDADGVYQPLSQCFRNSDSPTTQKPEGPCPAPEERLKGTWLFGGLLYQHFGHALLESTGRLWARSAMPKVNNIVFLTKKEVTSPNRFIRPMRPMVQMFSGGANKLAGVKVPTLVDRLVLAPQGFGTGDMVAGCPEMRDHIHAALDQEVKPEGSEKLYISRTALYSKRGRYLGEDRIEKLLEAEGYSIFHPQEHDLETQAARYAAAKTIVSSDNSALHLAAFFAHQDSRLAIIMRRPGNVIEDYLAQYKWFAGMEPDVIDALNGRYYQFEGAKKKQLSELYSELDFPTLGRALQERGYIASDAGWTDPTEEEIEAERQDLSERLGSAIVLAEDLNV